MAKPIFDPCQRLPGRGLGIGRHEQNVAVKFAELCRIVATQIAEEQVLLTAHRDILGQCDVMAVCLLDGAPAVEMQAFRIAPPLLP